MAFALGIPAAVTTGLAVAKDVLEVAGPIIDRFFPDPEKRAQVRNQLIQTLIQGDVAQMEVNKAEAASGSLFVAGWRPFIGWIMGVCVMYVFLLAPIAQAIVSIWRPEFHMPAVNDHLWELVFGMLGMGALRSFDKFQGVGTVQVGGTSPSVKLGKSLEGAR